MTKLGVDAGGDALADSEDGLVMAHVDHGAIRIEVIAGPVDLSHVCAAQTAETLDLNFMTASLFDDQAGRIGRNLLTLGSPDT